jgi:beta-lactamase regulating signal transducer with metallopeptidase domain
MKAKRFLLLFAGLIFLARVNGVALGCAACFGQSDSPMAHGMNAGIYALLGVVGTVLCATATFFVFLARRSAAVAKLEESSTEESSKGQ